MVYQLFYDRKYETASKTTNQTVLLQSILEELSVQTTALILLTDPQLGFTPAPLPQVLLPISSTQALA